MSRIPFALVVAIILAGCDDGYQSQIHDVPGPTAALDPDPADRARWTTTRAGDGALRALACQGGAAYAVGRGAAVWIAADGTATATSPPAPDLGVVVGGPDRLVAAGRGALYVAAAGGAAPETWTREALPRADAVPQALAFARDVLWVAGHVPRGGGTVGWVARRRGGTWIERLVEDVPTVAQVVPQGESAILVVESTPYDWTPGARGGALRYHMPAQPDAHPPIAALSAAPFGFHAVGPNDAWRLEGTRLVRELRQLYLRLESVASLPGGRAIAVGRDDPPGGRAGGVAYARDPKGRWRRELFTEGQPLHAIARCAASTIAVGESGLVATRRD